MESSQAGPLRDLDPPCALKTSRCGTFEPCFQYWQALGPGFRRDGKEGEERQEKSRFAVSEKRWEFVVLKAACEMRESRLNRQKDEPVHESENQPS